MCIALRTIRFFRKAVSEKDSPDVHREERGGWKHGGRREGERERERERVGTAEIITPIL